MQQILRHLGGDRRIGREPVLHKRKHAERQRQRKFGILAAADLLLQHEIAQRIEIILVEIAVEGDEVQFTAFVCREDADVIIDDCLEEIRAGVEEIYEKL